MAAKVKPQPDAQPLAAVVDVKIDVMPLIKEALERLFPTSEIVELSMDWDRFADRDLSLEDFWVPISVELQES